MAGFGAPPAGTPPEMKTPCRKCGYPLNTEASVCGNCGTPQSGKMSVGRGTTYTDSPISGKMIGRLVTVVIVAAVFLFVRAPIMDAIDSVQDAVEDVKGSDFFSPGQGDVPGIDLPDTPGGPGTTKGFKGVRELVDALHKGGFDCNQTKIDSEGGSVSTGSCQGYGAHVQINVYLDPNSLASAENSFFDKDYAFSYVHKDNWFVITQHAVPTSNRLHLGPRQLHRRATIAQPRRRAYRPRCPLRPGRSGPHL
jgi:hypothetical protein